MISFPRYLRQQLSKFTRISFIATNKEKRCPQFSTFSSLQTARSPRVKLIEQHRQQRIKQESHPSERSLQPGPASKRWPTAVLQAAQKSNALPISLQAAVAILDDFESLRGRSGNELCSKHGIKPRVLTLLALILLRAHSTDYYSTARELLFAASELNEPSATFKIAESSIRSKKLTIPYTSLQHLDRMVSGKHPVALFLKGRTYEEEGNTSKALKMFEESISASSQKNIEIEAVKFSVSDAWRGIFRIKLKEDRQGAESALRTSALEYDDPKSYYLLAEIFTPKSSQDFEAYMLKAAASGESEAADALGVYYFKQSQGCTSLSLAKFPTMEIKSSGVGFGSDIQVTQELNRVPPEILSSKRNLAEEWFKIGAVYNIESSQVHLAILLREAKKLSEGMGWLEKASSSIAWAKTVSWLKEMWDKNDIDFMLIDIEKLHKREDGC